MKPLITIGSFRICQRDGMRSGPAVCIEHRCDSSDRLGRGAVWYPFVYGLHYRGIPCFACRKAPPEGIQAMFWFLREADE